MIILYVIDLSKYEPGCTGHPLMRLNRKLREAKKYDSIKIIFNLEDLPFDAAEILLKRNGFEIKTKEVKDKTCILFCTKKV